MAGNSDLDSQCHLVPTSEATISSIDSISIGFCFFPIPQSFHRMAAPQGFSSQTRIVSLTDIAHKKRHASDLG